jgi:hypothetical protein
MGFRLTMRYFGAVTSLARWTILSDLSAFAPKGREKTSSLALASVRNRTYNRLR